MTGVQFPSHEQNAQLRNGGAPVTTESWLSSRVGGWAVLGAKTERWVTLHVHLRICDVILDGKVQAEGVCITTK